MSSPRTVVVSGPPCSGKSTYIDEHRSPNDIVIDLDRIAYALGYPTPQIDFDLEHPARQYALIARASILKRATRTRYPHNMGRLHQRRPPRTPGAHRPGPRLAAGDPGQRHDEGG